MSTNYPTSLQTFEDVVPGIGGSNMGAMNLHSTLHNDVDDTVEAIQAVLGYTGDTGSSVTGQLSKVLSGSYTPTLTGVTNVGASTAYQCQYTRVGDVVTVSGKVAVDPTSTGSTQLGISLPIASDLANDYELAGTAFASGIAGQGAAILGDATNDRAQMEWIAVDVTNQPMYFTFQYLVI